jgi:hypothetical protein
MEVCRCVTADIYNLALSLGVYGFVSSDITSLH